MSINNDLLSLIFVDENAKCFISIFGIANLNIAHHLVFASKALMNKTSF